MDTSDFLEWYNLNKTKLLYFVSYTENSLMVSSIPDIGEVRIANIQDSIHLVHSYINSKSVLFSVRGKIYSTHNWSMASHLNLPKSDVDFQDQLLISKMFAIWVIAKTEHTFLEYWNTIVKVSRSAYVDTKTIANLAITDFEQLERLEDKMSQKTVASGIQAGAKGAASFFRAGAEKGIIGGANRSAVEHVLSMFGDNVPEVLKTEAGLLALEAITPTLALIALEMPGAERLSSAARSRIARVAGAAAESASHTAAREGMSALDTFITPVFEQYLAGAQKLEALSALGDSGPPEEVELDSPTRVPELAKVL